MEIAQEGQKRGGGGTQSCEYVERQDRRRDGVEKQGEEQQEVPNEMKGPPPLRSGVGQLFDWWAKGGSENLTAGVAGGGADGWSVSVTHLIVERNASWDM